MKKILFAALLLLSLMVCVNSPLWAGCLSDAKYGRTAYADGDYDEAIRLYTRAIESGKLPREILSDVYHNRGLAWGKKGDHDKAIVDYTKAIEIDPREAYAYDGLAWLMATCAEGRYRDGKRAVELAEKALVLKETYFILNTLAAAYAEAGRFQEAIKTQERAIAKLKQEVDTQDLPVFEKHLSSYKAGKPWREK